MKEEMLTANKNPIFPKRQAHMIDFVLSPVESVLYQRVTDYVKTIFNLALMAGGKKGSAIGFMLKLMQRRLNSSVRSIRLTLENRKARLEAILNDPNLVLTIGEFNQRLEELSHQLEEAERNDDVPPKQVDELIKEITCLTMAKNRDELQAEVTTLGGLVVAAQEAESIQCESKLTEVLGLIDRTLGHEQLIIFTEYRDTLDYLVERIPSSFSTGVIHGEMDNPKRKEVQKAFWKKNIQILICTDAASEGINLQCCWNLINYDIPWNPNRLDQRMGRIHRYLQDHECHFYNLVAVKKSDGEPIVEGEVVKKLFEKIEIMRRELGGQDRVFDVIGEAFEQWRFEELLFQSLSTGPVDLSAIQFADADAELKKMIGKSKEESSVGISLDFFFKKRYESEEHRLWPRYIAEFVALGMLSARAPVRFEGDGPFKIQVPQPIQIQASRNRGKYGDLKNTIHAGTFKKPEERALLVEGEKLEYITAGHPFLEAIIDLAIKDGDEHVRHGTVLLDPSHGMHGLLWFMNAIFTDGTMSRKIFDRIIILYTPFVELGGENGKVLSKVELSPLTLWDLRRNASAAAKIDLSPYVDFYERVKLQVVEGFGASLCTADEAELREWRQKAREFKMKGLEQRRHRERGRLEKDINKLYDREDQGEDVKDKLAELEGQRGQIDDAIKEEIAKADLGCKVVRQVPKLLSVAIIVPARQNGDAAESLEEAEKLADVHAVELAAMDAVMRFEKEQGRGVQDMSSIKCGYDIESTNPQDINDIRHIEVKGHSDEGGVFITVNEWLKAQNDVSGRYWLYIVNNVFENPRVITIQDPASRFIPEKIITEKFLIPATQLKEYVK